MLTTQLIYYYNHLLATTVLYLTIADPLKELTTTLNQNLGRDKRNHSPASFVLATTSTKEQDYYSTLGVNQDATKHEIHKAFRQLAKKYHPDKNKDKGAQDEFIKIFKAYETLSDEKKRKEYDDIRKGSSQNQNTFNGWHTNSGGMNDFDMNEFFKQYEDQLFRHTSQHFHQHQQHHQNTYNHHNHHHDHFTFHGVNLDDLFHDIDEDEFQGFGRLFDMAGQNHNSYHQKNNHHDSDGVFGDGASFFGTHLPSQIHDTLHHYQHQQNIHTSGGNRGGYSCQTITKQVNGMVMTQTSCM